MSKSTIINVLQKVYLGILILILAGIVVHAPFSVYFGVTFPKYSLLIKSWKEILMLLALLVGLVLVYLNKQVKLFRDPIIIALLVFALLHFVLLPFSFQGWRASGAGLIIDLRYFLYFGLVYVYLKMYPRHRPAFIKAAVTGALIVLVFAMLQVFVLPKDFLAVLGYGKHTIQPYLLVDKNSAFVRINSTLRGPNPLGAYALMTLTLLGAFFVRKSRIGRLGKVIAVIVLVGGLVALWSSYSRSAQIGLLVSALIISGVYWYKKVSKKALAIAGVLFCVLAIAGAYLVNTNPYLSNVVLHINPSGGSGINSNEGHVKSINESLRQVAVQPLGSGIGSTGSASLLSGTGEVIENQFLFVAHEAGWAGLIIYVYIIYLVMKALWQRRSDWLALGVLASGISLLVVGLFLPVFADDTISIVWWGVAAVALATPIYKDKSRAK